MKNLRVRDDQDERGIAIMFHETMHESSESCGAPRFRSDTFVMDVAFNVPAPTPTDIARALWVSVVHEVLRPTLEADTAEEFERLGSERWSALFAKLAALAALELPRASAVDGAEGYAVLAERWGGEDWRDATERGWRARDRVRRLWATVPADADPQALGRAVHFSVRWTFAVLCLVPLAVGDARPNGEVAAHLLRILREDMSNAFACLRAAQVALHPPQEELPLENGEPVSEPDPHDLTELGDVLLSEAMNSE